MVKTIFLCRRRGDLSHETYTRRLLDGHVPLALRHHPTMRRYVVNIVDRALPDTAELDSVGQLWFDSLDDFRHRLYDSAEGERIIGRDVAGFMGEADAYSAAEIVHREPPGAGACGKVTPGVKLIVGLRRNNDLDRDAFLRHWIDRHAPLVLEDPRVRGYVANVVESGLYDDTPALDGIAELWFDSDASLAAHMTFDGPLGVALRQDLPRFLRETRPWVAREFVQR